MVVYINNQTLSGVIKYERDASDMINSDWYVIDDLIIYSEHLHCLREITRRRISFVQNCDIKVGGSRQARVSVNDGEGYVINGKDISLLQSITDHLGSGDIEDPMDIMTL